MTEPTWADELAQYEFEGCSCYYSCNAISQLPNQRYAQVKVVVPFEKSDILATWTIGDKRHRANLRFGQVCVIAPEQPYQIQPQAASEMMLICLPLGTISESTQGALRSLNWKINSKYAVSDSTVVALAKELREWLPKEDAIAALYRRTLIRLLSVHLVAKYAQADFQVLSQTGGRQRLSAGDDKLALVISYIQDHLDQNLKVRSLAKLAGLSQSHFSRMFKRSVGLTPHQYILSQRIQLAKTLLYDSQISLSEISFQCGFYDQSHFILQFRRFVGVTPKAYRERRYRQDIYVEKNYSRGGYSDSYSDNYSDNYSDDGCVGEDSREEPRDDGIERDRVSWKQSKMEQSFSRL